MEIAFIGLRSYPSSTEGVSGIEVRTEHVINYISELQNITKIHIFTRSWIKKQKTYNNKVRIIPIPTIKNKYLDTLIFSFLSSLYILFLPVQIVFYEGTCSTLFSFIPRLFRKKIVTTIHSLEWKRKKWNRIDKYILMLSETIGLTLSHIVIGVSKEIVNYVLHKHGISEAYCIPPFFEIKDKIPPQIIRSKYSLKKNGYILYLGRIVPEKRIEWLIQAYQKSKCKIKLVIAGDTLYNYRYLNSLKSLSAGLNILFTGFVFGREKEELLSNCFLYVNPSEIEGFSVGLMEALSYRKNILVAKTPDVTSTIKHDMWLFRLNDFNDFLHKFIVLTKKTRASHKKYATIDNAISKDIFFNYYETIIHSLA